MGNKFSVYQKYGYKSFFTTFLLIFVFSNAKSNANITSAECLEIKNEINHLRPKYEGQKIEITDSNAPVLARFVNKYLQKFCAKTDAQFPPVCLYYNSKNYENYNYYWDGKSILIGSGIVNILFYSQKFEKYFGALLAHEFAHFKLNHNPNAISSTKEEDADKLAFTLIDNPKDLVSAHLFDSLTFIMAKVFTEYPSNENKLNMLIAQTMGIFTNLCPDFGNFAQCSCWMSVFHLLHEAFIKTELNTNLYLFSNELALNLVMVSSKAHSKFNMDYLKIWKPRLIEFLKHPLVREIHPSPKQLSTWCQNILANQVA